MSGDVEAAVGRLDAVTRRLRRECPWDREQTALTIVPHTVEEAYELADAARSGDDARMRDELGDVLFQVHFLSLLLEERGAGSLADVAEHCRQKLVRRHPHVFGDAPPSTPLDAGDVLRNWDAIKRDEAGREPGVFGEVPENLPGPLLARKVQRRAASTGFDPLDLADTVDVARGAVERVAEAPRDDEAIGDALFALVNVARKAKVDPELALRSSVARFRSHVEAAAALAASHGEAWDDLDQERQLSFYVQSRAR